MAISAGGHLAPKAGDEERGELSVRTHCHVDVLRMIPDYDFITIAQVIILAPDTPLPGPLVRNLHQLLLTRRAGAPDQERGSGPPAGHPPHFHALIADQELG